MKDLLGQTRRIQDAQGQLTELTYDTYGRLSEVKRGSQIRKYTYNDVGWLMSQTQPEEGRTVFEDHTILGLPTTTKRDLVTVSTTLDDNGRVATLTASGLGSAVVRSFTYVGNSGQPHTLTETQDQGSITETYEYDGLARLKLKTITDSSQTFTVSRKLDSFGKVSELNYPEGGGKGARKVVPHYDGGQRLESLDFEGSNLATMAYDVGGADLDKLTYVNAATTTWLRNGNQDLSRVTHRADGADVENLLVEWTLDGLMKTRGTDTFDYDDLGRLHLATVSGLNGEKIQQTFGYDEYGNRNSVSSVAQVGLLPKEAASFALTFGSDNRLPATTAAGALTGASYDALGRLQEVFAVPGDAATRTSWVHDALGRVVRQGGADAAWQERYLLDGAGLRFRRTKQDGTVVYTVYGFQREPLSTFEVAAPNGSKALKLFHGVANAGALSRSLGTFQSGDVATVTLRFKAAYGVSAAAFLTDGKPPAAGDHKAFASMEGNGGWQQMSFSLPLNAGENLTLSLYGDAFTATSMTATAATYVIYDDVKVTSVQRGTVLNETFEAGLDGLLWLGCGQVNEWVDLAAPGPLAWKSDAVYGWGQLIFEKRGTATLFQQGDHLGSPSILTDSNGKVVGRQKSLPFGERLAGTGQTSLRRFTNHEDGPQYPVQMQARMYLPSYGRFAEVDPVYDHSSDGLNLYSYVSNNPVTQSDPDGMREMGSTSRGPQYQDGSLMADQKYWSAWFSPESAGWSASVHDFSAQANNYVPESTAVTNAMVSPGEMSQTGETGDRERIPGTTAGILKQNKAAGFKDQDEAATAALTVANPKSIKANREYGGLIYKKEDGSIHFTGPVRGTDQGVNAYRQAPAPEGTTVVGDYHTHGDYSVAGSRGQAIRTKDPSKDQFGSDRWNNDDRRQIIHDARGNPSYRAYLGTPSGRFLYFDPVTGAEGILR